jgi:hypothetical protein
VAIGSSRKALFHLSEVANVATVSDFLTVVLSWKALSTEKTTVRKSLTVATRSGLPVV